MATKSLFITFEGTEGSGKSTQMNLLVERLEAQCYDVVKNQEPGGTGIGKEIRRLLLDPAHGEMAPVTELLLMFASRAQAASEVIRPALANGCIVVSDRFTDSTLAYQGEARGLGFDLVRRAHDIALGSLWPNITLCMDLDIAEGLERARRRNANRLDIDESRIDRQSPEFHARVRNGYLKLAALEPHRFHLIDGTGNVTDVQERIWNDLYPFLSKARPTMKT